MGGFVYSPLPEDHATDETTYWARKSRKQSEAMAARREAHPVTIPSLTQIFRDGDQAHDAQVRERKAEIAADPYAFTGQGMGLPRSDPKAIEARNRLINGETA